MAKTRIKESWILLAMDIVLSLLSSLLAILMVRWLSHPVFGFTRYVIIWLAMSLVFTAIGLLLQRIHRIAIEYATLLSIGKISAAILIKELLMLAVVLLDLFGLRELDGVFLILVMDALLSFAMIVMMHVLMSIVIHSRQQDIEFNISRMSILVYGVSNKSAAMIRRLLTSSHYNPIGFITSDPDLAGMIIQDIKAYYCKDQEAFQTLCLSLGGVDGILFSRQSDIDKERKRLMKWSLAAGVSLLMSPNIEVVEESSDTEEAAVNIYGEMADNQHRIMARSTLPGDDFIPDGMSGFERNVKRCVDCLAAAILLIVFSPLFLICYIAIKLEDKGPAIYKQERIGRFGRSFDILKFRTMKVDAEANGPALFSGDDDPRLTRVGKFLRSQHLDELPQLWNVFMGEMAFVGYRPERQYYIDKIMEKDPRYICLYQIRPGVTSYATLRNGYTDTIEKMIQRLHFDLYYLKNRSWWFDIKVLWLTFVSIVFGKKF